eukprot:4977504-Pleurochrysis_carterae.AAC.6
MHTRTHAPARAHARGNARAHARAVTRRHAPSRAGHTRSRACTIRHTSAQYTQLASAPAGKIQKEGEQSFNYRNALTLAQKEATSGVECIDPIASARAVRASLQAHIR